MIQASLEKLYSNLSHGRLEQLCELARLLGTTPNLKKIQDTLIAGAMLLTDAEYGSIQLLGAEGERPVTLERVEGILDKETALRFDRAAVDWVEKNSSPLRSEDLSRDSRCGLSNSAKPLHSAILAAPIRHQGEPIGVLIVGRPTVSPFTPDDEMLLVIVTELCSSIIYNIRRLQLVTEENQKLKELLVSQNIFQGLTGRSAAWKEICAVIKNVAPSEARILIVGESGTGKELCARAVHQLSKRKNQAFVAVNCAAMPESLAESELFGYVKGAFTGAGENRRGLFGEADGGTLFLDEIGSASPQVQSSLLRAIQEGEIRPVGATVPLKVDVRLICATSCDLEELVKEGKFRKDLFFRINVVTMKLAALRERREDIAVLANEFLTRHCHKYARDIKALSPEVLAALEGYTWPGNVRELENAIEHAILFTPPGMSLLTFSSLPSNILTASGKGMVAVPALADRGLDGIIDHYEKEIVRSALEASGWNQSQAARSLNIPEKRIRDRIKKYDLRSPEL